MMPIAKSILIFVFFFFQAEDGIRDWSVTGVQTCALPILGQGVANAVGMALGQALMAGKFDKEKKLLQGRVWCLAGDGCMMEGVASEASSLRSEERRVGKECRSRWSPYH